MQQFETIYLEKHEYFIRQTYRNRCYINTAHGVVGLSIPVTSKHGKATLADVRIDNSQKWLNNHWRTICAAYGKAPYFEYYADDLEKILFTKFSFLFDLNLSLMTMCLKHLRFKIELMETLSYEKNYANEILDMRSLVNAKNDDFIKGFFRPKPYQQVFGNAFVENLSIIDLIFCCGPEAGGLVIASFKQE